MPQLKCVAFCKKDKRKTNIEHLNMDINTILDILNINPDSLSEKQRKRLDKKIFKVGDTSICEGYNLTIKYKNVKTK